VSAILEPAGAAVAGQQTKGITQQYQKAATASAVDTSTGITPYDSGTILGNIPPGKSGEKLVNGTVQRSSQIVADSTSGAVGNALVCVSGVGVVPTPPTGSSQSDGLSQYAARE
jgi:hypothetical protein